MSNHFIVKILQNHFRRRCRRMLPVPAWRRHPTYPRLITSRRHRGPWPHAPANIFEHDVVRSIVGDAALVAVFNHGRWNRTPRLHEPLYKNLLGWRTTAATGSSVNNPVLPQVSHLMLEWVIAANVKRLYWRRQTARDYSNIDVVHGFRFWCFKLRYFYEGFQACWLHPIVKATPLPVLHWS